VAQGRESRWSQLVGHAEEVRYARGSSDYDVGVQDRRQADEENQAMSEELNIGELRSENAALHRSNSELRTACNAANDWLAQVKDSEEAALNQSHQLREELAQAQAERHLLSEVNGNLARTMSLREKQRDEAQAERDAMQRRAEAAEADWQTSQAQNAALDGQCAAMRQSMILAEQCLVGANRSQTPVVTHVEPARTWLARAMFDSTAGADRLAERDRLRLAVFEADEYLSSNPKNYIGNGSILHQRFAAALAAIQTAGNPAKGAK
jgi:myosin heavy subunit